MPWYEYICRPRKKVFFLQTAEICAVDFGTGANLNRSCVDLSHHHHHQNYHHHCHVGKDANMNRSEMAMALQDKQVVPHFA